MIKELQKNFKLKEKTILSLLLSKLWIKYIKMNKLSMILKQKNTLETFLKFINKTIL